MATERHDAGAKDSGAKTPPPGTDTPTGTDPDATYDEPGFEDKSLGQAVAQDEELVDELAAEHDDLDEAEREFEQRSAGAPTREKQGRPETG